MDNRKTIEYTLIIVSLLAVLIFAWELTHQDVRLCRFVLEGLVKGSAKIEKFIDWEKLKATGIDIGAIYRRIHGSQDKEKYRSLWIRNFATGFNYVRGDVRKFSNWRVLERQPTKVVVGADYLLYNKTILFTLSKLGKTKIIAIEWKQ